MVPVYTKGGWRKRCMICEGLLSQGSILLVIAKGVDICGIMIDDVTECCGKEQYNPSFFNTIDEADVFRKIFLAGSTVESLNAMAVLSPDMLGKNALAAIRQYLVKLIAEESTRNRKNKIHSEKKS